MPQVLGIYGADLEKIGIPYALVAVFVFILGLCIGSFLNVVIYRLPAKISIAKGRSFCPSCGAPIKGYDNIPLISYLFLLGKCRHCKAHISIVYPAVEFLTGALFLLLFVFFGLSFLSLGYAFLISCVIAAAFIDAKTKEIPNSLIVAMLIFGVIHAALNFNGPVLWWERLIGFAAASVPLLLAFVISRGGMGGADIKLMAAAGLFLGWKLVLVALLIGIIVGAICVLILAAMKKAGRKTAVPFAPYLSIGIIVSIFAGNDIVNWYASLLGLK